MKTNTVNLFLEQIMGITIISYYYFLFFKLFLNEGVVFIFEQYLNLAIIICLIGVPLFMVEFLNIGFEARFHSILTEPAHFVAVILPALFYAFYKKNNFKLVILTTTFFAAMSSLGFLALMINIVATRKINFKIILILFLLIAGFAYPLYSLNESIKIRVNDSFEVLVEKDLTGANLSTYAFFSNAFVAVESIKSSPLIGSGLGAHILTREKYLSNIDGIQGFEQHIFLNEKDANSLFLRITSDLGLIGIFFTFLFLFKNYVSDKSINGIISKCILSYFICKLIRDGHYFSPEMYFFIILYYFNKKDFEKTKSLNSNNVILLS
jgi:hypothetical protein